MYLAEAGHIHLHLSKLSTTTRSFLKHIFIRYGMFRDQLKKPELVVLATILNLRSLNCFNFHFINTPHNHENVMRGAISKEVELDLMRRLPCYSNLKSVEVDM